MKRAVSRLLGLCLALSLIVGLIPAARGAEADFVIKNGVLTAYNGPGGDVVIPSGVTAIGEYALTMGSSQSPVTSLTIPASVKQVQNNAFAGTRYLTEVTFLGDVESIGDYAFQSCLELNKVTFMGDVGSVGQGAFATCLGLTTVTFQGNVGSLGERVFSGCELLTSVTFQGTLDTLGDHAFSSCDALASITLPQGLTTLNSYTFMGCRSLADLQLPSTLQTIQSDAIRNCMAFSTLVVPEGVRVMGDGFFSGQDCALTDLYLPVTLRELGAINQYPDTLTVHYAGTKDQWDQVTGTGRTNCDSQTVLLAGGAEVDPLASTEYWTLLETPEELEALAVEIANGTRTQPTVLALVSAGDSNSIEFKASLAEKKIHAHALCHTDSVTEDVLPTFCSLLNLGEDVWAVFPVVLIYNPENDPSLMANPYGGYHEANLRAMLSGTGLLDGSGHTITFDPGRGTLDAPLVYTTNSYGRVDPFPPDPVRPGCEFLGWETDPDDYYWGPGDRTDVTAEYPFGWDATVTAKWRVIDLQDGEGITVTFKLNGGAMSSSPVRTTNSNGKIVPFPSDPVREGYEFMGWISGRGGASISAGDAFLEDATVTALWRAEQLEQPSPSTNIHNNEYTVITSPIYSNFRQNPDGGYTRLEVCRLSEDLPLIAGEEYDAEFHFLSGRQLPWEYCEGMPMIWGGAFLGKDYNFLIFGKENPEEDDTAVVIRVVKYSKDWERLDYVDGHGGNTTTPFVAGATRCAEGGGMLYIHTGHEMYHFQGENHQGCMTVLIRQSDLKITASDAGMFTINHSMNQFVLADSEGDLVMVDHGDGRPRCIFLERYSDVVGQDTVSDGAYGSTEVSPTFRGGQYQNQTGASVGGLAETTTGYVVSYNDNGRGTGLDGRQIYLSYVDKTNLAVTRRQLTTQSNAGNPLLVPTGLEGGYILWNELDENLSPSDTLCYAAYAADGTVGSIRQTRAPLSDCQPIAVDGKPVWYVTDNSAPAFYVLDPQAETDPVSLRTPGYHTVSFSFQNRIVETQVTGPDGKLEFLPVYCEKDRPLEGWFTSPYSSGGEKIITTDTVFTENTTVYARLGKRDTSFPGPISYSADAYQGVCDGKPHAVEITAPAGATVRYGLSANDCTLSASPSYTQPGSYRVYYTISQPTYPTVTNVATVVIHPAVEGLADQTWTVNADGSQSVRCVLTRSEPLAAPAQLLCASYDEAGRMVDVQSRTLEAGWQGSAPFTCDMPKTAVRAKFFCLEDGNLRPLLTPLS